MCYVAAALEFLRHNYLLGVGLQEQNHFCSGLHNFLNGCDHFFSDQDHFVMQASCVLTVD